MNNREHKKRSHGHRCRDCPREGGRTIKLLFPPEIPAHREKARFGNHFVKHAWSGALVALLLLSRLVGEARGYDFLPTHNGCTNPQIGFACTTSDLGGVVDEWIANGTRRAIVVAKYGPIEEWDTSKVTGMKALFRQKSSFNADLSKWNTAKVSDMELSTFLLSPLFEIVFFNFFDTLLTFFCIILHGIDLLQCFQRRNHSIAMYRSGT